MNDNAHRAERWKAKFKTDRVKATLDDLRDQMAKNYEIAAAQVNAMEWQVRQELDMAGVSSAMYVPYLNFGRQIFRMIRVRNASGESAAMEAKLLLDKWAARGCRPEVLADIRFKVFNIKEPAS